MLVLERVVINAQAVNTTVVFFQEFSLVLKGHLTLREPIVTTTVKTAVAIVIASRLFLVLADLCAAELLRYC